MWLAILGVFALGGLGWIWPHSAIRGLFYDIGRLEQQRMAEEALHQRLLLELETLRSPKRIEKVAVSQLHLVVPSAAEAVILERVRQSPAPSRSIVARRQVTDPQAWRDRVTGVQTRD